MKKLALTEADGQALINICDVAAHTFNADAAQCRRCVVAADDAPNFVRLAEQFEQQAEVAKRFSAAIEALIYGDGDGS